MTEQPMSMYVVASAVDAPQGVPVTQEELTARIKEHNMADTVWILAIDHDYGTNLSAHKTETGARDNLAGYVAEWWHREMGTEPLPDEPDEAIDVYFERVENESYTLEESAIYE